MEITKKEIKHWHMLFLITNGINFIFGLFLLSVFSYFIAKNKFQDSLTISFILFFILYVLISVIGHLWLKKSLCLNYIYLFFALIIYFVFFFLEWFYVINDVSFKSFLMKIFKNSEKSYDALYDIFSANIEFYKIFILINSVFFVNYFFSYKIFFKFLTDITYCDSSY